MRSQHSGLCGSATRESVTSFLTFGRIEPWPREIFGQQLRRGEEHAGLERLKGGVWHPYRRKWATDRKDRPVVYVKAGGGWRGTNTLLTCYHHTDEESMLRVMEAPERLRTMIEDGS